MNLLRSNAATKFDEKNPSVQSPTGFERFRHFAAKTALFVSIPLLVSSCSSGRFKSRAATFMAADDSVPILNGAAIVKVLEINPEGKGSATITIANKLTGKSRKVTLVSFDGKGAEEAANGDTCWIGCGKIRYYGEQPKIDVARYETGNSR